MKNLFTFIGTQWKEGRDSKFSRCCIVFFLFRYLIYRLTGRYLNYPFKIKECQHVYCPIHYLWHLLIIPVYYTCDNCHWTQYKIEECERCKDCKHIFPKNKPTCTICGYERYAIGINFSYKDKEVIKEYFYD